jgi:hypothetical protein
VLRVGVLSASASIVLSALPRRAQRRRRFDSDNSRRNDMNTKRIFALLGLAALLPITAIVSNPVSAGDGPDAGQAADGVWCYIPDFSQLTPVVVSDDYMGPKLFFQTVENAVWTGTFSGESMDFGVVGFPSPTAAAPSTFAGTVIFESVEVEGLVGGLELDVFGGKVDLAADFIGTWLITSASGELADLQGHGDWWGPGYNLGTPSECGVIYYSVEEISGINVDGKLHHRRPPRR